MLFNLVHKYKHIVLGPNKIVRNYKTYSLNEDIPRHFPPGNKEWKNSVYTYNKDYIKGTNIRDKMAGNAIKSYLNIVPIPKKIPKKRMKSQRMRNLIRRSTTKKLFVSRPEIKQNNDKAIITVYTFDRENQLWTRRLYFFYKWLYKREKSYYLNKRSYSLRKNIIKLKGMKRKFKPKKVNKYLSRRAFFRRKNNLKRREMKRFRIKTKSLINTMFFSLWRKRLSLRMAYLFYFLRFALSALKIKAEIPNPNLITMETTIKVKGKEEKYVYYVVKAVKKSFKKKLIITINGENTVLDLKTFGKDITNLDYLVATKILIRYLFVHLKKVLEVSYDPYYYFNTMFKAYIKISKKEFFKEYFLRELLAIKYLSKIYINKFKFSKFIPGLKLLLNKLYNKKIELNLVNLKYLHLNSNNLTEALTIKLRKKKGRLLRVLRKSLKLVRLPREFTARLESKKALSSKIDNKKNYISIVNSLKYKWISGIRLEAKGRLTRRYTASRSVFKYKYKGNLRNLDNLYSTEYKAKSPSVFMMRGQFRPNLEHSFAYSKKRIGAFGIKTWLSGV